MQHYNRIHLTNITIVNTCGELKALKRGSHLNFPLPEVVSEIIKLLGVLKGGRNVSQYSSSVGRF